MLLHARSRKGRLPPRRQGEPIELSAAGSTARAAAEAAGAQANAAPRFLMGLGMPMSSKLPSCGPSGEVAADESHFGGGREGRRGRGAAGEVAAFGPLKRGGKACTAMIPAAAAATLLPIIEEKAQPGSIAYTDALKACNALDASGFRPMRINRSEPFADKGNRMNGIGKLLESG